MLALQDKQMPQSEVGACGLYVLPENTDRFGAALLSHRSPF
jgi:hypothetical protein